MRRILMSLLLAVLFSQALLLADQIQIVSYDFEITGKTKDFILRDTIGSDEPELFDSEDELKAALDSKRQSMINRRIFSSVEYTYALGAPVDSIIPCNVVFTVVDSRTVLFLPYPKYDSNYGMTIGIKGYNTNLFGRLSSLTLTLNAKQVNHSFRNGAYYGALTISNLNLNKIMFNLNLEADLDVLNSSNTDFKFSIGSENLRIADVPISINPWVTLKPMSGNNKEDWRVYEIGNSFSIGPFYKAIGGISFSNYLRFRHIDPYSATHPLYTSSSVSYHGVPKLDVSVSLVTESDYASGKLDYITIGPTVGYGLRLFKWMNWYNSLSHYSKWTPSSRTPRLEWGSTLSRSAIDWHEDFRDGLEFSIYGNVAWYYLSKKTAKPNDVFPWYVKTSVSWFPLETSWFNPSVRVMGIFSNNPQYFMDSDSLVLADYLRGISMSNDLANSGSIKRKVAYVLNANLTFKFIRLADFLKTYAIAFTDVALVSDDANPGQFKRLTTVGLEGVGILVSHPSYPVRMSLGFNLDDLVKKIKGILEGKVEYELFIGLGFFF